MYRSKSKHLVKRFGKRRIADITKSDLELFQAGLLKGGLSPKTVNDIFTVVRGVWGDAFGDGVIRSNPLDRIKNIERDQNNETADPFTREEIQQLTTVKTSRKSDVTMFPSARKRSIPPSRVG